MADIGSRPLSPEVRAKKIAEIRREVAGIVSAARNAETDEDFAALGKRFGACQRRSREVAGQGKGG